MNGSTTGAATGRGPAPGAVALVTGGTGGFGSALARQLREREVTTVLTDLDGERARQVAADLGAHFLPLDVTDRAANQAVVAQVEAEHGRVDAVYLNAGIAGRLSHDELDMDELLRIIDIDLFGVIWGVEAARPVLARGGGGAIVVTASLAGLAPLAHDPGYSVAKGGAIAFVRSMAPRLAREGTTISAICPSFADTAIIDFMREEFAAHDYPVIPAADVAGAMVEAWAAGEPGAAYVVQAGAGTIPYRFKGVPGARRSTGEVAVVPERLRPPEMR